ncbi:MAG TPA: hypothetical protein VK158_05570, partial [Acidobacteriota bacterium]|nr:hypothetical protein [Acidobacteriota bacterium]
MRSDAVYYSELIQWILANKPTKHAIHMMKLELCKKHDRIHIPTDIEIYMNTPREQLASIRMYLQTKPTRTSSGVAVIATMS